MKGSSARSTLIPSPRSQRRPNRPYRMSDTIEQTTATALATTDAIMVADTYPANLQDVLKTQQYLNQAQQYFFDKSGTLEVARTYLHASESAGGVVKLLPNYAYVPVIVGRAG